MCGTMAHNEPPYCSDGRSFMLPKASDSMYVSFFSRYRSRACPCLAISHGISRASFFSRYRSRACPCLAISHGISRASHGFTCHETRASGQEVFNILRVGSGRSRAFRVSRVGSGRSGAFQISRVGSGWVNLSDPTREN